jgi:RNA polymerase sigma-70 factor, ECF subfamily
MPEDTNVAPTVAPSVVETPASVAPVVVDAEDLAIVEGCVKSDPKAFTRLHEKYAPLLASVLRKFFKNDEHRVADAMQDVFVRLYEKPERFSSFCGQSKLGTWLTRIGINIATTLMKKSKRTPDGVRLTKRRTPVTPPDIAAVQVETIEKIDQAIAAVPEDLRKLLLQDESLSYSEVALALGLTENQVRGGLYRARKIFRDEFEKEGKS